MLDQALNVKCNLRTVVESVWFDDVATGSYDLAHRRDCVHADRPV